MEILVRRKNRSGRTKIYGNNPKIMVRPWNSGPACALAQYEGSIAHQLSKGAELACALAQYEGSIAHQLSKGAEPGRPTAI